jgi:hypothetical protein
MTSSGTRESPCVSVVRAELIRCPISNEQKQHDEYVKHEHYEDKERQAQNERLDAIDEIDQGPIGDGHQSASAREQYSVGDSFLHVSPLLAASGIGGAADERGSHLVAMSKTATLTANPRMPG